MSKDYSESINEDPDDSERWGIAPNEQASIDDDQTSAAPAKGGKRKDDGIKKQDLPFRNDTEQKAKYEQQATVTPSLPQPLDSASTKSSLPVFNMGPPKRRFSRRNSKVPSMFVLPSASTLNLPSSLLSPVIIRKTPKQSQQSPPSTASWLSSLPVDGDTTHQSSESDDAWWGNTSDPSFSSSLKRSSTPDNNDLTVTDGSVVGKRPRRNSEPWSSPTKRSPPDEETFKKDQT
jgi:hypothetical protein